MESEKDLAEHMMLVDLEKHDLSSVCVPGSVKWAEFRIESHPNVHHLVSEVSGELEPLLLCDYGDIFLIPRRINNWLPEGDEYGDN